MSALGSAIISLPTISFCWFPPERAIALTSALGVLTPKRSMIEARERVETLKTEVALVFAETTHLLGAALTQEAANSPARAALADLWKHRLQDAEQRGDRADTAHALALVERYSDGPVPSDGSLTLTSDPPGAEVLLYRYEAVDGVLAPQDERRLGKTPFGPGAFSPCC